MKFVLVIVALALVMPAFGQNDQLTTMMLLRMLQGRGSGFGPGAQGGSGFGEGRRGGAFPMGNMHGPAGLGMMAFLGGNTDQGRELMLCSIMPAGIQRLCIAKALSIM